MILWKWKPATEFQNSNDANENEHTQNVSLNISFFLCTFLSLSVFFSLSWFLSLSPQNAAVVAVRSLIFRFNMHVYYKL